MKTSTVTLSLILILTLSLGLLAQARATGDVDVILNGSFENNGGNNTPPNDWYREYDYCTNLEAHTGTYSLYLLGAGTQQFMPSDDGMPVDSVKTFTLWGFNEFNDRDANIFVTVTYEDGSSITHSFTETREHWAQFDMKPYLTAGQFIDYINFENGLVGSYMDDVSLTYTPATPPTPTPAPTPPNYGLWFIWAIIIAGLVVLGMIVYSASRQNARGK